MLFQPAPDNAPKNGAPSADVRRLPNPDDPQAVNLPEALNFQELYTLVTKVCEHLGAMTGDWWRGNRCRRRLSR